VQLPEDSLVYVAISELIHRALNELLRTPA